MKTPSYLAVAGFIVLAAGCSTPGDLRVKSPSFEAASHKNAKAVAGCIGDRWEAAGHRPTIASRPTTNGYALSAEADVGFYGKDAAFVIDVDDTKSGSNARFYSNMARAASTEMVASFIKECQK